MDRQMYHASSWTSRTRMRRHAESLGMCVLLVEECLDACVLTGLEVDEGSSIPSVMTLRRQST